MTESTSNNSIAKLGKSGLSRYSNALVRRAVQDIAITSPQVIPPVVVKKRILVLGWEIGELLADALPSEGYETDLLAYHGGPLPSEEVFSALSHERYDLVLVSLWNFWEILLEIRQRFPFVKTIFMNSYKFEWDEIAIERGVNAVIRVPFEYDELLDQIGKVIHS